MTLFDAELVSLLPKAWARQLVRGNKADVEDLVQETVCKALQARAQYVPGTKLKSWLFTIMRNLHYDGKRTAGRLVFFDPDFTRSVPSASDTAAACEAKDAISHLILIHPLQAEAVLMLAMGDQIDEAAVKLGIPDGTVKSRVSRGRAALAEMIGGVPV